MQVEIEYFAVLREQAGRESESFELESGTPADIYAALRSRYGFELEAQRLRVAVNDVFADWSHDLSDGDRLVFIPPVAGG